MNFKTAGITTTHLNLLAALFLVFFCNFSFFQHVIDVYPVTLINIGFLLSLAVGLTACIVLFLTLTTPGLLVKPVLIFILIASSIAAYFMNMYGIIIDDAMIQNTLQTDFSEASDLFSAKLLSYCLLLGILPSIFVYRVKLAPATWKKASLAKIKTILFAVVIVVGLLFLFSKFYTSFFREHKSLRSHINPISPLYSIGEYINKNFTVKDIVMHPVGLDAHSRTPNNGRKLIILVVGEAARADHFSLNGYQRNTNPLLQGENVVSFTNMYSSDTSTATSLPKMFSLFSRSQFKKHKGATYENLLDVLQHAGVSVVWLDNNSSSKGVADRILYRKYKKPDVNPICDIECRDEGMLVNLQDYIDAQKQDDILIVLHQMGNHGPAYYKRYPAAFGKFQPTCQTNQLEECTREEIDNAYDNAILYTDYFLKKVIDLLKKNAGTFNTAMVYMSDHGESLGEYGIYLHGMPYAVAPEAQTHIASVLWLGNGFNIGQTALQKIKHEHFSHYNLSHTILGMMEIETSVYKNELDILHPLIPQR